MFINNQLIVKNRKHVYQTETEAETAGELSLTLHPLLSNLSQSSLIASLLHLS